MKDTCQPMPTLFPSTGAVPCYRQLLLFALLAWELRWACVRVFTVCVTMCWERCRDCMLVSTVWWFVQPRRRQKLAKPEVAHRASQWAVHAAAPTPRPGPAPAPEHATSVRQVSSLTRGRQCHLGRCQTVCVHMLPRCLPVSAPVYLRRVCVATPCPACAALCCVRGCVCVSLCVLLCMSLCVLCVCVHDGVECCRSVCLRRDPA